MLKTKTSQLLCIMASVYLEDMNVLNTFCLNDQVDPTAEEIENKYTALHYGMCKRQCKMCPAALIK